jgi:hypothetical protein
MRSGSPYKQRPDQVQLCLQVVSKGDLAGVGRQVEALLYQQNALSTRDASKPTWLYYSLVEAISKDNTEMVRHLLDHGVANGKFPVKAAVRARIRCITDVPRS